MIKVGFDDDPNLPIVAVVTAALGDLCESLVFVGGCATGLLLTAPRAELIRATEDVDLVVEAASLAEYHELEAAIAARRFVHDRSPEAPMCRWVRDGVKIDLMPTEPILGFHNRTKLEAFHGRGSGDYLASHDLEDVLTVVDGREELIDEARTSPPHLRRYLEDQFSALLATADFVQAIPGHLPGDPASQARAPILMQRLRLLTQIAS